MGEKYVSFVSVILYLHTCSKLEKNRCVDLRVVEPLPLFEWIVRLKDNSPFKWISNALDFLKKMCLFLFRLC